MCQKVKSRVCAQDHGNALQAYFLILSLFGFLQYAGLELKTVKGLFTDDCWFSLFFQVCELLLPLCTDIMTSDLEL